MNGWSEWSKRETDATSPYVEWEIHMRRELGISDPVTMMPSPASLGIRERETRTTETEQTTNNDFPVPTHMVNPHFDAKFEPQKEPLETLGAEDVVVGVIDIDVAFGNRNFRKANGDSRVLGAWQQGTVSSETENAAIPFGRELRHADIQKLLNEYSVEGDLKRAFDHDSFYRDVGLIREPGEYGMGSLAKRTAHGTHVMGAAAGADPKLDTDKFSEKVKLFVVNLPPPVLFGEGGAFLDDYLAYGLRWIIKENSKLRRDGEPNPPPLFINISFGKQAGGRDTTQKFVAELLQATDEGDENARDRGTDRRRPTIFLPAGNDNQERCHAKFRIKDNKKEQILWRVQPDDNTSNFVELWDENSYSKRRIIEHFHGKPPIEIEVFLPGADTEVEITKWPIDWQEHVKENGFVQDMENGFIRSMENGLGRIFFDWVPTEEADQFRPRYIICLSPTGRLINNERPAPAGAYTISLHNNHPGTDFISLSAHIQTDEVTLYSRRGARRSYFDDSSYVLFEKDGRRADTFYNGNTDGDKRGEFNRGKAIADKIADKKDAYVDKDSKIKRKGTLNAYAQNNSVTVIGGFRASDGRPALYSGSGGGEKSGPRDRGAPTASLPSDDGYAHFGILSDGARDGSTVAMRGTSFACATAVRLAVKKFLKTPKRDQDAFESWSEIKSFDDSELRSKWANLETVVTKVGELCIPYKVERPIKRM